MRCVFEENVMPLSFNCPNCSAPLDVNVSSATTQRCPYCNTCIIVPQELRENKSQTVASSFTSSSTNVPPAGDNSQILESVRELAIAGDDIEAIKLLRTNFEIGLKDASDLVKGCSMVNARSWQVTIP
jgi:DNA-directed RNA polymerase subunit RPC12/RpoP